MQYFGVVLTGKRVGAKMLFFLRFPADSVVLLTHSGLDKDGTDTLLATTPLGIGAAFSLGRVFPVGAEMQTAQCSFGSHCHLRRTSEELD